MENVVSRTFDSPLGLDQMFAQLDARIGGIEWTIRESEHDDRYIKGLTSEGVKLRILSVHDGAAGRASAPSAPSPKNPGGRFEIEVYFPLTDEAEPALSNADKRVFMKRLDGHVLAAIRATNIKDE